MSDIGTPSAPAPAPASSPAPAPAHEVPVSVNPVSSPQPVGPQAPPAPVGDVKGDHHPMSRREQARDAIKRAIARAEPPKSAGSKMGHNQPPEPTKVERAERPGKEQPRSTGLDLTKRPADQPRGEHGRFVPQSAQSAPGAVDAAQATDPSQRGMQAGTGSRPPGQPAAPTNVVQLPEHAPYREPPRRWDERARAEWSAAPESVRASVHRMHNEFSQAYQRMHGDHQEMNRIRHFHDMAKQHGTTLGAALTNYTGMEHKLRTDPIGALDVIVSNLNLRTQDGQKITLPDIAWHILNQTPDQHKSQQMQNSQAAIGQQLQQMQQQQRALAQQQAHMQYQQRYAWTRRGVDRFAETHPRLDELGDLIQQEINVGYNLPTAYQRAALLRPASGQQPATQAAQTRTGTQAAQTRNSGDRSIHGAPDASGSRSSMNGRTRSNKPPPSRRDTIVNAIRRSNGSL